MGSHRERSGELAPTEDLDQATLGNEPVGAQDTRVDVGTDVEAFERVEVHDDVLHAERVPEALGLRRAAVQRRLAAFEAWRDGVARAGALHAASCRLPALARDPAPDPPARLLRTGRRLQIVDLHEETSSTRTRWGTRTVIRTT